MSFLPVIKARKLIPILLRMGFKAVNQRGSHLHFEHVVDRTRKITVPVHNKDLAKKTLLSIIKQLGISVEDFLRLLGR